MDLKRTGELTTEYELSSVVREHCEFWSQGVVSGELDSSYYRLLTDQICAQHGIILHHYEDVQRSGVAVAAFASGIRVYKTRGRGPYVATTDIRWEGLDQVRNLLEENRQ